MKKQKVYGAILCLCISCILLGGVGGCFASECFFKSEAESQETSITPQPTTSVTPIKETSDEDTGRDLTVAELNDITSKIALVDLDEGVKVGGKVINYASTLIDREIYAFVNASMEEARDGLENGTYIGYIVIPAKFSSNIQSINSTPKTSNVSYEVNSHLDAKEQAKAYKAIMEFQTELNDDIGYMYLSQILKEFHSAQDNANTVLATEKEEIELVKEVQKINMINFISVSDFEQYPDAVQAIDLSQNDEQTRALLDSIKTKYEAYMTNGQNALNVLGEEFTSNYNSVYNYASSMGSFKETDGSGKYCYEEGLNSMNSQLNQYNTNLADSKSSLEEAINMYNTYVNTQNSFTNEKFNDFKDKLKEQITNELNVQLNADQSEVVENEVAKFLSDEIETIVEEQIKQYFANQGSSENINVDSLVAKYDASNVFTAYNLLKQEVEINRKFNTLLKDDTLENIKKATKDNPSHELNTLAKKYLQSKSSFEHSSFQGDGSLSYFEQYLQSTGVTTSTYDQSMNSEIANVIKESATYGANSLTNVEDDSSIDVTIDETIADDLKASLKTNLAEALQTRMNNVLVNKIETMDSTYDNYSLPEEDTTELQEKVNECLNGIGNISNDSVVTNVQNNIINSMKGSIEKEVENLALGQNNKMLLLKNISGKYCELELEKFINKNELQGIQTSLSGTIQNTQEKVNTKMTEYQQYASDSAETARKNQDRMYEEIQTGNEAYNTALNDQLAVFKETSSENYAANAKLLNNFLKQLSYTRLGDGPFVQMNKFILQPVNFTSNN